MSLVGGKTLALIAAQPVGTGCDTVKKMRIRVVVLYCPFDYLSEEKIISGRKRV